MWANQLALGGWRPYDFRANWTNRRAQAMSMNPAPRIIAEFKPKHEIKVDLDERAYLLPPANRLANCCFCQTEEGFSSRRSTPSIKAIRLRV